MKRNLEKFVDELTVFRLRINQYIIKLWLGDINIFTLQILYFWKKSKKKIYFLSVCITLAFFYCDLKRNYVTVHIDKECLNWKFSSTSKWHLLSLSDPLHSFLVPRSTLYLILLIERNFKEHKIS